MSQRSHNEYLKTQVMTASQEQLILMLFDGALRFCSQAKAAWVDSDLETAHNSLVRSQNIVLELTYALDKEQGGELAENMARLYNYCYRELVQANLERDAARVDDVVSVLEDLRAAWSEAMEKAGVNAKAESPAPQQTTQGAGGTVLARLPVAQVPAATATDAGNRPRLSVQG